MMLQKTKLVLSGFRNLALIVTLGVALNLGCTKRTPEDPNSIIKIGEVGSMTGSEATFGNSTHNGITLAIEEINAAGGIQGKKLKLVTLDDQGKTSEAVLAIKNLISQHQVKAVLGEVASSISIAMAPIAEQFQVPMITPSSINTKVTQQGKYIFRACFIDQFQSRVMAQFASKHLHSKRAALLIDNKSDYSRDSAKIFAEYFKKTGGEIVVEQSYSAGDIDFKSQLTAIRGTNPDLIVVPGYYTEVALIGRQKEELGIQAPMLGGDAWDSPKLIEIAGNSLKGSYFVTHFYAEDTAPNVQKFIEKYKSTYGAAPDGIAALGYDATYVLIDALKRAQGPTSQDLREAIASTKNLEGVTGKITLNTDRNAETPAIILQVTDGGKLKFVTRLDEVNKN